MFGMKGFHVSASGAIQGHHGPLVFKINRVQAVDDIDKLCKFHENPAKMQTVSASGEIEGRHGPLVWWASTTSTQINCLESNLAPPRGSQVLHGLTLGKL